MNQNTKGNIHLDFVSVLLKFDNMKHNGQPATDPAAASFFATHCNFWKYLHLDIPNICGSVKCKPSKWGEGRIKTLLYAAVGTASHQHAVEARAVNRRSGNMVEDDKGVLNLPALNQLVKMFKVFIWPSINAKLMELMGYSSMLECLYIPLGQQALLQNLISRKTGFSLYMIFFGQHLSTHTHYHHKLTTFYHLST
jgi:hypothetical protein